MKTRTSFRPGEEHRLYRHGHTGKYFQTKEYRAWSDMKTRCTNPKCNRFEIYGGRGIKVCDDWMNSFELFFEHIGEAPSPHHSIDRIDSDGDYEPGNVRWATDEIQSRNRRSSVFLTYDGRTQTLKEWAEEVGMQRGTLAFRIKSGWSTERALTQPVVKTNPPINPHAVKLTYDGRTLRVSEWSKKTGLGEKCIRERLKRGWTVEQALTERSGQRDKVRQRLLTLNGETRNIAQWAKKTGLRRNCIEKRLQLGWSIEDTLTIPAGGKRAA